MSEERYMVYWDNGVNASGVFPERFESEKTAQAFADRWMEGMGSLPEAYAEVISELETQR